MGDLAASMHRTSPHKTLALLRALGFIVCFVLLFIGLSLGKAWLPQQQERYAHAAAGLLAVGLSYMLFARIEAQGWEGLGLQVERRTIGRFSIGLFAGLLLANAMVLAQVGFSGLILSRNTVVGSSQFVVGALALLPLAWMEELAFRGYPFLKLQRTFGLLPAQLLIALLFAGYHVLNGWPLALAALGPGTWSLAFGLCAAASNGIAIPTGLHFGLNTALAVFGIQKGVPGLWNIDLPEQASSALIQSNERFGVWLQLGLLVLLLAASIGYWKRQRKQALTRASTNPLVQEPNQ